MTDAELELMLDSLNKKDAAALVFLTPLSAAVDYGKAWAHYPLPGLVSYEPQKVYCIKNNDGIYVAVVLNIGENLHWLVGRKHRRHGYLPAALKDCILPHLFQYRRIQRLLINRHSVEEGAFDASVKIALKAGFVPVTADADGSSFMATYAGSSFDKNFREPGHITISKERIVALKKQMNFIAQSLLLVQTEIEIKRGVSKYSEKLKDLSNDIYRNMDRLDSVCLNQVPQL
jgi:hypothetical protein